MYRFFQGKVENGKLIDKIGAADSNFPYTEPQIGDFINLPFDANPVDQELWQIKQRVIHNNGIEFMCERHIWED